MGSERICGALDFDGYICTERASHEGDHIAGGIGRQEIRRWSQGEATDPLQRAEDEADAATDFFCGDSNEQ